MSMEISRKEFLAGASACLALRSTGDTGSGRTRAMHVKLGSRDAWIAPWAEDGRYLGADTSVDVESLRRRVASCRANGVDTLVVELGEGVALRCNPEGNLAGALSPEKLNGLVREIAAQGITVVPLVNFSSAHCGWMGTTCRMLSSPEYRKLAHEAIREACEIFEKPKLVHIGMDDENHTGIQGMPLSMHRRAEVLWDAIGMLAGEVEAAGAGAWMWSDSADDDADGFVRNVSRGILQSPRYPVFRGLWIKDDQAKKKSDGFRMRMTSLAAAGFRTIPACTTTKPRVAWEYPDELDLAGNPAEIRDMVLKGDGIENVRGFVCAPHVAPNAAGDGLFAKSCQIFGKCYA